MKKFKSNCFNNGGEPTIFVKEYEFSVESIRTMIRIALTLLSFLALAQGYSSGFTLPKEHHPLTPSTLPPTLPLSSPLQLTMQASKPRYRIGEYLSLSIQTNKACYLTVIDIGTSGKRTLLFPNAYQPDNFLAANQILQIPNHQFKLEIGKPAGEEVLWAVCRVEDKPLLAQRLDFDQYIFHPLPAITQIEQLAHVQADYLPELEARSRISVLIDAAH